MWERSTAPPHCCVETSPAALWLVPLSRQLWLIFGGKCSQLVWLVEKERSTVTPTDCPPRLCDYGNVSRRRPYRLGGALAGRRGGKWTVTANSAGETVDVQTACDPAESTQTQSRYHFKNIKPIMIKGYSIIFFNALHFHHYVWTVFFGLHGSLISFNFMSFISYDQTILFRYHILLILLLL